MKDSNLNRNTQLYGLIGNAVSHSYSPIIHNYLFNKYDINGYYKTFNVHKDRLEEAIEGLKALNINGVNITAPFKEQVSKYVENQSDIKVINTIKNNNGKLIGYNTDYFGVLKTFQHNNITVKSKKVLILGSGGVAKTICEVLCNMSVAEITILNRSVEKAKNLIKRVKKRRIISSYGELNTNSIIKFAQSVDILVNATSKDLLSENLIEIDYSVFKKEAVFFDVIYNPFWTKLLEKAKENGFKCINGIDMLLFQGLKAFEIWTGINTCKDDFYQLKNILSSLSK